MYLHNKNQDMQYAIFKHTWNLDIVQVYLRYTWQIEIKNILILGDRENSTNTVWWVIIASKVLAWPRRQPVVTNNSKKDDNL